MTDGATLSQCFVLVHERTALLRVTLEARFVSAQESKTAGFELLLNVRWSAFDRDAFVHFVTIGAAHFAFRHGVMVRQLKCRANFQMTLETGFRGLSGINNRASSAACFDMQTPWAVARFAPHIHGLLRSFAALCAGLTHDDLLCLQSRVGGCSEVAHNLFVTGGALFRANKFRTRNTGWSENCAVCRAAGKQNYGQCDGTPGTPQQAFVPAEDPSS
jgi:hypothetical protein